MRTIVVPEVAPRADMHPVREILLTKHELPAALKGIETAILNAAREAEAQDLEQAQVAMMIAMRSRRENGGHVVNGLVLRTNTCALSGAALAIRPELRAHGSGISNWEMSLAEYRQYATRPALDLTQLYAELPPGDTRVILPPDATRLVWEQGRIMHGRHVG